MIKNISLYNMIDELKQFGFDYLTSESCGYSMRGLYDINENAQDLLSAFLGHVTCNANGWNSRDKKSVMLSHATVKDLLIFCSLQSFEYILLCNAEDSKREGFNPFMYACNTEDECLELRESLRDMGIDFRLYNGVNRNQHQMSGRMA